MDTNELHASGAFYAAHLKRCKICNAHSHTDELCTTCLVQEMRQKRDRNLLVLWLAITILLVSAICSFAQRGTGANPVATTEQTTVSIFAMPQAAVAPFKQRFLGWDYEPNATYRVLLGSARGVWTNSLVVTTNEIPITNGVHYAVITSLLGVEGAAAFWPSNRVGELWLVGMSNDMKQRTNIVRLTAEFDEVPPGNMQLWGIENRTVEWK